jgi:hypothetical protein
MANIANRVDSSLPDFEMIGLFGSSNHRSCERHAACGQFVNKNDTLRLVSCLVDVSDGGHTGEMRNETSIKLFKIEDGTETCTVAFVPKAYASMPSIRNSINKFVTVFRFSLGIQATIEREESGNGIVPLFGRNPS